MINLMIDIETLGTKPGCAILSIAAVPFNVQSPLEHFYEKVDSKTCLEIGLHADANTIAWWAKQDERAYFEAFSGTTSIQTALERLYLYIMQLGDVRVWGNGASFDVPILEAAYIACGQKVPWKYHNSLCYRTLKNLYPWVPFTKPVLAHSALEDAKAQAVHAENILRIMKGHM